ncbi:alpha/beta hydrolase [Mammaliicoccus stepanovicii]|uniref:Alpha/beta hydrolase n=1 Tax=Mammaliicoccus stepanovicii TaxID=643214 RepID=A0A239Y665_9STAP|nr:alpha/beta hydrolase [Mammaliicoccus stepanovicii]
MILNMRIGVFKVKKLFILGVCLIGCVVIGGFILFGVNQQTQTHSDKQQHAKQSGHNKFVSSQTPTLFLHGYAGSANSEKFMVNEAKDKGVTKHIIKAYVSRDGEVQLKGKWTKDAINPIVQIELENNKQGYLDVNANWIKNVLTTLQSKYNIKKFNFVGHSMGNLSFATYMMTYGNDPSLPKLNKQVNIAGTFNGVLNMNEKVNEISVDANGKPSRMNPPYPRLRKIQEIYKGQHIDVLNIYGDLQDGTHSDGRVSNSSSKSLKYLLGNSPQSYRESKYEGPNAQHSQLHENSEVANDIIKFLWER